MEKFLENQNNSESEQPKAVEKASFKNKLKRFFGTSAAIGATALMVGCGKGNDANAINNTPAPADDNGPKTESNIEDAGIATSQDVDSVDFWDGTSVDVSGGASEVEVASGEVDPAKYWEGDTFHLDEYAEALGYEIKPSSLLYRYDNGSTKVLLCPSEEKICFMEGEEITHESGYGITNPDKEYQDIRNGDINIEFNDSIIGRNNDRLDEYIETLQWLANTNDPYSLEDHFDYWH